MPNADTTKRNTRGSASTLVKTLIKASGGRDWERCLPKSDRVSAEAGYLFAPCRTESWRLGFRTDPTRSGTSTPWRRSQPPAAARPRSAGYAPCRDSRPCSYWRPSCSCSYEADHRHPLLLPGGHDRSHRRWASIVDSQPAPRAFRDAREGGVAQGPREAREAHAGRADGAESGVAAVVANAGLTQADRRYRCRRASGGETACLRRGKSCDKLFTWWCSPLTMDPSCTMLKVDTHLFTNIHPCLSWLQALPHSLQDDWESDGGVQEFMLLATGKETKQTSSEKK